MNNNISEITQILHTYHFDVITILIIWQYYSFMCCYMEQIDIEQKQRRAEKETVRDIYILQFLFVCFLFAFLVVVVVVCSCVNNLASRL